MVAYGNNASAMPDINLQIGRGARQSESLLIETLLEARRSAIAEHGALGAAPLALVVPSRSLRLHALRRLAALNRPEFAVGLQCLTVYGLALQLADLPPLELPETLEWMAERFARRHPGLTSLDALQDGFAPVSAPVRDLLDAGLRADLADRLLDVLDEPELSGVSPRALGRARALIEVAARTDAALEEFELPSRARTYRLATEAIADGRHPQFSSVVVHGFAEVTGVVGDFLEALLRTTGGTVVLDSPPDPIQSGTPGSLDTFTRRLRERIELLAGTDQPVVQSTAQSPALELHEAPEPKSEVECVAQRIRDLLDDGTPAEDIGLVIRDPTPYKTVLADRLERLSVPFSVIGFKGSALPARRRFSTLLDLIDQRDAFPIERWLEIQRLPDIAPSAAQLALALASRGLARLADFAELSEETLAAEPEALPLPLPRVPVEDSEQPADGNDGLEDDGDDADETDAKHATVPRSAVLDLLRTVRGLLQELSDWETQERVGAHREALARVVFDHLTWSSDSPEAKHLQQYVLRPLANLPSDLPISLDELRRLVARLISDSGQASIGGAGSGIQILDVMSARGRTFDTLFLLGLNRGNFPRTIREDALLPDAIRDALAVSGHGPLPDLPRKKSGFDEENHLFAQLLSSANAVHLSWSRADGDGDPLAASPWIDRLRSALRLEVAPAPSLWANPADREDDSGGPSAYLRRRPADEWARLAGLHAHRADFSRVLPYALAQTQQLSASEATTRAAIRRAVLDELDPDRSTSAGHTTWARLGPYSGLLQTSQEEPGQQPSVWVTELEAYARCSWRYFLARELLLEPWSDPLSTLPDLDGLIVGSTVHRVLQAISTHPSDGQPTSLEAALGAMPRPGNWPPETELRALVRRIAQSTLAREGLHLPGLLHGLEARVLPLLAQARDLAWGETVDGILGAELNGQTSVSNVLVRFRVDQVQKRDGQIELIDFKTGRPLTDRKKASTRHNHLLAAVTEGRALQAPIYARAAGAPGVYLYLTDLEVSCEDARRLEVTSDDKEVAARLQRAVSILAQAKAHGIRIPRLNIRKEGDRTQPRMCALCPVAQACLQHESTARNRQRQWVDRHMTAASGSTALERDVAALWWMPPPTESSDPTDGDDGQ